MRPRVCPESEALQITRVVSYKSVAEKESGNDRKCSRSLKRLVIRRAEILPRVWHRVDNRGVFRVFGEDDSQASLQVPVDVAVQEPWARVVSLCGPHVGSASADHRIA